MREFEEIKKQIQDCLKELEEAAGSDQKKKLAALALALRGYRAVNKLTIDELAKKLFVTKMCLIRWEKGEVMPIESNLARFRDLGITTLSNY